MFNVRVYGILINEAMEVLVSDLLFMGREITKFPGGGLEFGEGTRDCLKREFMEELNLSIEVEDHLYTTDFFQVSAFNPSEQIISVYYKVRAIKPLNFDIARERFAFSPHHFESHRETGEAEIFRFIPINTLTADQLTLPIDKLLVPIIQKLIEH